MTTEPTPEEATTEQLEALLETIANLTLTQLADLLGRAVSRLDELALEVEITEEPK